MLSDEQIQSLVLAAKLVSQQQLTDAKASAKTVGRSLEETLVEKGVVTPETLGKTIADSLNLPYVSLTKLQIPEEVINLIPPRMAKKYKMVAFSQTDGILNVAAQDTPNAEILEMLTRKTGLKIVVHYTSSRDMENAMQFYQKDIQKIAKKIPVLP